MPFELTLRQRLGLGGQCALRFAAAKGEAVFGRGIGLRSPLSGLTGTAQIDDVTAHGFFRNASIDTTLGCSFAG